MTTLPSSAALTFWQFCKSLLLFLSVRFPPFLRSASYSLYNLIPSTTFYKSILSTGFFKLTFSSKCFSSVVYWSTDDSLLDRFFGKFCLVLKLHFSLTDGILQGQLSVQLLWCHLPLPGPGIEYFLSLLTNQEQKSWEIFFMDFDYNYYNNSLKYAVNRTLFP